MPLSPDQPAPARTTPRQIVGLDLLRFAAALMVMGYHLGFWIWSGAVSLNYGVNVHYRWLAPFTWFGWVGVEIFFVISGFVIPFTAHSSTAGQFVRNRVLRLYPAALLCSTFSALLLLASHSMAPRESLWPWLRSIVIFPFGPWIDGAFWTLPIEINFYFLIFLLLACKRFHAVERVMIALGILSSAAVFYLWSLGGVFSRTGLLIDIFHLQYGIFFAIGTLLWLCSFHRVTTARVLWMSSFGLTGVFEIVEHAHILLRQTSAPGQFIPTAVLVWLAAMSAMIAFLRWNSPIFARVGPRGARTIRTLGLMTYPLYLIHQRVGILFIKLAIPRLPELVALALAACAMIAASFVIANYLENPLKKVYRKVLYWGAEPRPAAPATALATQKENA